jgi:putative ABC transport system permease protein
MMFRFAISNLRSRPVRSALSVLGLTVAIAGMVGLFSIAGGIRSLVTSTFEMIPGIVVQQRGAPFPLFSTLPSEWGAEMAKVPGVAVVNAEAMGRVNIIDDKNIISPPRFLIGFEIESRLKLKTDIFRAQMKRGRYLEPSDRGTNRCLVSQQIANEFQKGIGDALEVNGDPMQIVGIYECGSLLLDVNIICDLDTCRRMTRIPAENVCSYYLEQDGTVPDKILTKEIEVLFRGRAISHWSPSLMMARPGGNPLQDFFRALDLWIKSANRKPVPTSAPQSTDPDAPSGVEVRSADDWADRFAEFSGDLNLFLAVMTSIGLVIAVLSIVNTMLMSVSERTTEFGVLRANGWSRNDILKLVTTESALLGITGGVLGSISGFVVTQVLNSIWPERLHLYAGPSLILLGLACSILLGVVGGAYPAWYAARMSPMNAIRRTA